MLIINNYFKVHRDRFGRLILNSIIDVVETNRCSTCQGVTVQQKERICPTVTFRTPRDVFGMKFVY